MSITEAENINRLVRLPVLRDSGYESVSLIMQLESWPISQDQMALEVKRICAGFVMVEAKCINIDAAQAICRQPFYRSKAAIKDEKCSQNSSV